MMVIELDNRRVIHLLAACAIAMLAAFPLIAQVAAADSAGMGDSAVFAGWKPGIQLRSVQFDLVVIPTECTRSLAADVDVIVSGSRPPFPFGIRAGGELVGSMAMQDYGYEMIIGNLLGRMSVLDKWVRLDLYGGYGFISRKSGGFLEPGGNPNPPPSIYHTLKLGTEVRIYLLPPVLALLFKYSAALDHPFAGRSRVFEMGGIGGLIGWQW